MPTAAPNTTSESQCRSSLMRENPVRLAALKKSRSLHLPLVSVASEVASANAIVVWPEGNELFLKERGRKTKALLGDTSGRLRPTADLSTSAAPPASAVDWSARPRPSPGWGPSAAPPARAVDGSARQLAPFRPSVPRARPASVPAASAG